VTLSYLHRALEPDRKTGEAPFFVRQTVTVLRLADAPHLVVDAHEFEALVERAEDADRRGIPRVALTLLEQGIAMWRGRCLADVEYEEWAQPARQRLTDRFVRAAVRAAELSLAAGRFDGAEAHARRALAADEWSEPAHRVLIAAALAAGDHLAAGRALAACERMLAELGVAPAPETSMLRRRLRHRVLEATA
jgi:LuxR family transcriptional regulator, maltose regulon positive regulatory protein